jgi:mannose-6-phosphate isomerase
MAIRLTPSLREKVWGKRHLLPWFPDSGQPIGEAWYLADRELPLLVKLLFTDQRLSVQVHPADGEDGPHGKTEMWHILQADEGAEIAIGFRESISRERLLESTRTGDIEKLLRWIPVKAGETYFTPAHTVHAIGAGVVLCEIQQNSDVTYRLWDYGRPRELHVGKAAAIADLSVAPGAVAPFRVDEHRERVAASDYFVTEAVELAAGAQILPDAQICHLWICLEGEGTIGGEKWKRSDVWLVPQIGEQPVIQANASAKFLRTWVP